MLEAERADKSLSIVSVLVTLLIIAPGRARYLDTGKNHIQHDLLGCEVYLEFAARYDVLNVTLMRSRTEGGQHSLGTGDVGFASPLGGSSFAILSLPRGTGPVGEISKLVHVLGPAVDSLLSQLSLLFGDNKRYVVGSASFLKLVGNDFGISQGAELLIDIDLALFDGDEIRGSLSPATVLDPDVDALSNKLASKIFLSFPGERLGFVSFTAAKTRGADRSKIDTTFLSLGVGDY
mmetsp:Transcript_26367/g.41723  ORF Transcript_26367/g.41723 Transcript_26367/m.41723 type:complete len:235 (+) Transcript_26367:1280-1984(+)